jgi:primosomal protein N' (replication factor Y)
MVRIVVRGESNVNARALADEIGRRLRAKATDAVRVLGPAPAPMTKLRGQYRYQIQLQSVDGGLLRTLIRTATANLKPPEGIVWTVDVDPWDMM